MMWLTVSIANMLSLAILRLVQKAFVPTLVVAIGVVIANFHAITELSIVFWLAAVAVVAGFYPAVNYLYFRVIRNNDLSVILPLLGLVPVFAVIFGWLILGQTPSSLALVGILFISLSIYSLQFRSGEAWYEPLRALRSSPAARAMLVISIITAIAAIGDKYAIQRSTTSIYFAINGIGAVIVLVICDFVLTRKSGWKLQQELGGLHSNQRWLLIWLAIIQLVVQIFGFIAVNISPNTSYTIAIRNLNIVVASLIALFILRERVSRYKLISYGLSALGVIMIAL